MVKLCKDCIWSTPESDRLFKQHDWVPNDRTRHLHCMNPEVNRKNPETLSCSEDDGSSCFTERSKKWFAVCGINGKQWSTRTTTQQAVDVLKRLADQAEKLHDAATAVVVHLDKMMGT